MKARLSNGFKLGYGEKELPSVRVSLKTRVAAAAEKVYQWHERPGALERLIPPWESIEVLHRDPGLEAGTRVYLRMRKCCVKVNWIAEHLSCNPGRGFVDIQARGPFASWRHNHVFHPLDGANSDLEDTIDFSVRGGWLGHLLFGRCARVQTERMLAYRHRVTGHDLACIGRYSDAPSLRILVSGASGLVGAALTAFLRTAGHRVWTLTRGVPTSIESIQWDPSKGEIDAEKLENFDAVVHLAGENVASGLWTDKKKRKIRDSRVEGTKLLVDALSQLTVPPKTFVAASAVGYYGNGEEPVDEDSPRGAGFLAAVCEDWEAAASDFDRGRVVRLRLGVVLSPRGGALRKMLPAFRMGLAGPLGAGKQGFPWVALDDVVYQIYHALMDSALSGPYNVVAPDTVNNHSFTKTLGKVLRRPTIFHAPAFAINGLLGEMGREMLLEGRAVVPKRLEEAGYGFAYPRLEQCLRHLLGRRQRHRGTS